MLIVSNAYARSKNIPIVYSLLSINWKILVVSSIVAKLVVVVVVVVVVVFFFAKTILTLK